MENIIKPLILHNTSLWQRLLPHRGYYLQQSNKYIREGFWGEYWNRTEHTLLFITQRGTKGEDSVSRRVRANEQASARMKAFCTKEKFTAERRRVIIIFIGAEWIWQLIIIIIIIIIIKHYLIYLIDFCNNCLDFHDLWLLFLFFLNINILSLKMLVGNNHKNNKIIKLIIIN